MPQTNEDLRRIIRRQLADQLPHLFPPNPPRDVVSARASVLATERAAYCTQRFGKAYRVVDPDVMAALEGWDE